MDHGHFYSAAPEQVKAAGGFFSRLLEADFVPRAQSFNMQAEVIWLHVFSDAIIALACFCIAATLFYFIRKRRAVRCNWLFGLFALFIFACGTTHVCDIIAVWKPMYRLDGVIKAFTAAAALVTALALWPLLPAALALPSPALLRRANEDLEREIAERRRAEAQLEQARDDLEARVRERAAELRAIVETAVDGIVTIDQRGAIRSFNRAAERIFGYTAQDVMGKNVNMLMPSPYREEHDGYLGNFLRTGQKKIIGIGREVSGLRKDGSTFPMDLAVSQTVLEHDRFFTGIVRDITERKQIETLRDQLLASERAARSEAERTSRMKDEFLATLSHELRTPLNAILGWSQLARGKSQVAEVNKALETIERNARVQVQLIEDLLDMSRIISGKMRLDVQQVDLANVIEAAVETVRPGAEAKEIRIQMILDPAAGMVMGDPNRLQQVVWNLLNNAIKFTPRGGRVQLFLSRTESQVEMRIVDTGKGIAPEFLPFVFQRFRQEDASTARRFGGLGLGLAITKHLVELHGGTVTAMSEGEGRGATFQVTLPVVSVQQHPEKVRVQTAATVADLPVPSLAGLRVVVVDDEADARELVRYVLVGQGAEVLSATTAEQALDLVRTRKPDLLISDLGMPGEDGYSLIRRVRSMPVEHNSDVPAIALTALARPEDRRRVLLSGFQMHVPKPVESEELIAVVATVCGRTQVNPAPTDAPTP